MKSLIQILIPILIAPITILGQVTADNLATKTTTEYTVTARKTDPNWKEDNVETRRQFYANTKTFDPAEDYEAAYNQNADCPPQVEKGTAKLMDDKNTAPLVYYNKAAVGTILKLDNPENGKTTYAIVVGKVAPIDSQSFLLVMNEKAAHNLSIKDYSSVQLTCHTVCSNDSTAH